MADDLWLKRIWLVNGVVLLPLMLFALGVLVYSAVFDEGGAQASVDLPSEASQPLGSRALRYDEPKSILGTRTLLVQVRYRTAYVPQEFFGVSGYSSRGAYWQEPIVNVLFIDSTGTARLLLDRPAYIRRLNYPSSEADSLQRWMSYEIAFDDTNDDGKLGEDDLASLYLTDLTGRRLRPVLPERFRVRWHGPFARGQQILLYALEEAADRRRSEDQLPQRAFLYDVARDSLVPFAEVNQTIDRASAIVGR